MAAGSALDSASLPEHVIKILVVGDAGTGKTSIIKRAISNDFTPVHKPTVGVDFYLKKFVEGGKRIVTQLWDIAGQDRFGTIYRVYYQHAFGALLVFDLTDAETFHNVLRWKREIDKKCTLPNGKPLPVWLCANKCDLAERAVDVASLTDFCKENGFAGWLETSAKDNVNVDESLRRLVQAIVSHKDIFAAQAEAEAAAASDDRVTIGASSSGSGAAGAAGVGSSGGGGCC